MQVGSVEAYKMNCFKHYSILDPKTGHIEYAGDQFGSFAGKEILWHVGHVDDTMHVVRSQETKTKILSL